MPLPSIIEIKKKKKGKEKKGGLTENHGYSSFSTMTGVLTTRASQEHNIRNK